MRRRIAMLLGAVLAASALAVIAPAPALANDVCVGQSTATTGPLTYPVTVDPTLTLVTIRQPRTVGFGFSFTPTSPGACASDLPGGPSLAAGGSLTGWCGHSSGQGTANGHNFAWISAGSVLILTGHVTGIVNAIPDPFLPNNSCLTGATSFIVTGAAVLVHCSSLASSLTTIDPDPLDLFDDLEVVVPGVLSVHTGPMSYHTSTCVPGLL